MQVWLSVRKQCIKARRGLYAFGEPGIGTTFIVSEVFKRLGLHKVYMPVPGTFFSGDFRGGNYNCGLFEEFEFENYKSNFSAIKRTLERRDFCYGCKYTERRLIKTDYDN
jgi:predicted ATPase